MRLLKRRRGERFVHPEVCVVRIQPDAEQIERSVRAAEAVGAA